MHYLHRVHDNTPDKFLFNPEKLPPISLNKLRYNQELFEEQMWFVWHFTIWFSLLPIGLVILGTHIASNSDGPQPDLVCFFGIEWEPTSNVGALFLMGTNLTTILQINCS
jgi:hypothetical protein